MTLDADTEFAAEFDDLLVGETHLAGEFVDADFGWHVLLPPLAGVRVTHLGATKRQFILALRAGERYG
jgi:hypothetical protein